MHNEGAVERTLEHEAKTSAVLSSRLQPKCYNYHTYSITITHVISDINIH